MFTACLILLALLILVITLVQNKRDEDRFGDALASLIEAENTVNDTLRANNLNQ